MKNFPEISWKIPWYLLDSQVEILALQQRLETEIQKGHPLFEKDSQVIGRRIDYDDVLVKLSDGKYAKVHLVWGGIPVADSGKFPSTVIFESLNDLISSMNEDAYAYGEDETQ